MGKYQRFGAVAAIFVAWLLAGCGSLGTTGTSTLVNPGEAVVVMDHMSGNLAVYQPGSRYSYDDFSKSVTVYNLYQQDYTLAGWAEEDACRSTGAVEALTRDGQPVWFDVTVLYRIMPHMVPSLHVRWGSDYPTRFVHPTLCNTVREVTATYDASLIYGVGLSTLEQDMQDRLSNPFYGEGLSLQDFLIRNIVFTEEYTQQIEATQIFELTQEAQTPTPPPANP